MALTRVGGLVSHDNRPVDPFICLPSTLYSTPDLAFFDVNKTGELAGRLSTDVHEVAEHLVEVRNHTHMSATPLLHRHAN